MKKIACLKGVAVLAAAAGMLVARAAVVESTDAETGYKVLTVEAGEFAEYATVLDASVPGLIKRGAGTAWLTGANGASVILAAATTVGRFTGPGSVSGADVTVTNAVRASCSDIFANKHATFANTLTFAAGATFVITDPENLETYAHSGSKPAFTAQTVNGTPIVTFEGEYDGPTKWALFKKGDNAYNFGPLVGTMLLVK